MNSLTVQLQPARSPGLDVEAAVARLRAVALAEVERGEDDGAHLNVRFRAAELGPLWTAIRGLLIADAGLAGCAIVCCEGDNGWDDYLLLHHFEPTEPLDELT